MNKLLLLLICLFIGGAIYGAKNKTPSKTLAVEPQNAVEVGTRVDGTGEIGTRVDSQKAEQIKRYLESKGSPLALYSSVFVWAGSYYHLDPFLLVAISGVESTFGKFAHGNNPFGLGGTRFMHFDNPIWAIDSLGKTLGSPIYRRWHESGNIEDLAKTFCPPNWKRWSEVVTSVKGEI